MEQGRQRWVLKNIFGRHLLPPGGGEDCPPTLLMICSPPVCSAATSSSRHLLLTLPAVTGAGGKAGTGGGRPGLVGAPEDSSDVLVLEDNQDNQDLQRRAPLMGNRVMAPSRDLFSLLPESLEVDEDLTGEPSFFFSSEPSAGQHEADYVHSDGGCGVFSQTPHPAASSRT